MRVLFLTTARITSINTQGIYTDLLREFKINGHDVYVVCPVERKYKGKTAYFIENGIHILKVRTPNIQKTNIIEKGLSTIFLGYLFKRAIKREININQLDLILYSTPPVTFTNLISFLKKKSNAKSYLLLKDIFPQNAVDLGMFKKSSFIYKYFRNQEIRLYNISDYIGCMSPANCGYLLKENKSINPFKLEVNPNSIDIKNFQFKKIDKIKTFEKYKIPKNKVVFIYGGNLGKPQAVNLIKKNIDHCSSIIDAYFVIVGSGTEFSLLEDWIQEYKPKNVLLLNELSQNDYNSLLQVVDVGLIFLNPDFTIPNFPSRLLSYMKYSLPVLCSVDDVTDIGIIAVENCFGYTCHINDCNTFYFYIKLLLDPINRSILGNNAFKFLKENYSSEASYLRIVGKL
jgi:glycosyltransferase involved in cell wall biosynthesis